MKAEAKGLARDWHRAGTGLAPGLLAHTHLCTRCGGRLYWPLSVCRNESLMGTGVYPGVDRCSKPPRQINAENYLAIGVKLQVGAWRYQMFVRGIKNNPKEHGYPSITPDSSTATTTSSTSSVPMVGCLETSNFQD